MTVSLIVAPFTGAWIETDARRTIMDTEQRSRPSRARGLKQLRHNGRIMGSPSRPSRARGLKHSPALLISHLPSVAPFTGAWIETHLLHRLLQHPKSVAPFTGAWIETGYRPGVAGVTMVAPFTGAWIETAKRLITSSLIKLSRPSRARGLKHLNQNQNQNQNQVAPFTGAWIETQFVATTTT